VHACVCVVSDVALLLIAIVIKLISKQVICVCVVSDLARLVWLLLRK